MPTWMSSVAFFADDAYAKEFLIGAGEDELEHACGVSGDVASGVVFVESAANDVVDFLSLQDSSVSPAEEISGIV